MFGEQEVSMWFDLERLHVEFGQDCVKLLHVHVHLVYVGHLALVSREADDDDVYNELILECELDTIVSSLDVKFPLIVDL